MAINIKKPSQSEGAGVSPHDQAADQIETEVALTTTKGGEVLDQKHTHQSEPVPPTASPLPYERIDVGMSFKMPVADYTMLEFNIRRSVPFQQGGSTTETEAMANQVFADAKAWVEGKLNQLIEEQQSE